MLSSSHLSTTNRAWSLLALLFTTGLLSAQGFTGIVSNGATGEPLPYASIYVKETGSGTVTNENGRYQLKLSGGNYTLVFQYLGYSTEVKKVSSGAGYQNLDVALTVEALNLEEIEVLDGKEDASYSVIRRAIAKADYHQNQVDKYTAQVYIKGTGKVDKIPSLLLKMVPKEDRADIDTTRAFVTESVSKITYTRPNTFSQEVISKYEIGDMGADATPYLFGTFYQPRIAGEAISPLSTRAFGYYRFEHEGLFLDRERFVNKIKVIPRSRGEGVFAGYIYILDQDWSIHSLDLRLYQTGFQFDIRQTYAPVQDKAWMPVSTSVDVKGKILGIALQGHYVSTVSDYDLTLNPDLPGYVEVIDEKTAPEEAKKVSKENRNRGYEQKLEEGGELTRKELFRLLRSYEKEERKEAEEPKVESNYTFLGDSAEVVRDTAEWNQLRPVPLTPLEVKSYAIEDSLQQIEVEQDTMGQAEGGSVTVSAGSSGSSVSFSSGKKKNIRFSPNLDILNAVEGFALGVRISTKKSKKGRAIDYGVTPRYGISWKRLSLKADFNYAKWKDGDRLEWRLEGGRFLRQFDATPAMIPLVNTSTMIFNHENFLSLYERAYGQIGLTKRWKHDADFFGKITYEDRRAVSNTSEAGLFNRKDNTYRANLPFNAESQLAAAELSPAATVELGFSWWPGQTYRITDGRREPIENSAPKLSVGYFGGLPGIANSTSDFHRLEASYQHRFDIGIRGKVDLLVRAGGYVSRENIELPDYKHFATSAIFFTGADPIGSYRLLPFYTYSTGKEYLETYAHYQFRKFLLSRIWSLQRRGIREDVFVNYLYTPESDHYFEAGYSIDNIFRLVRLEFVSSFQDFKFQRFGIRVSVASVFGRGR